jgi:hypothetical protein
MAAAYDRARDFMAVVTGAFSYSGGVIGAALLSGGADQVVPLSRRAPPAGHPLAGRIRQETAAVHG